MNLWRVIWVIVPARLPILLQLSCPNWRPCLREVRARGEKRHVSTTDGNNNAARPAAGLIQAEIESTKQTKCKMPPRSRKHRVRACKRKQALLPGEVACCLRAPLGGSRAQTPCTDKHTNKPIAFRQACSHFFPMCMSLAGRVHAQAKARQGARTEHNGAWSSRRRTAARQTYKRSYPGGQAMVGFRQ